MNAPILEFKTKPVMYLCSSRNEIEVLVKKSKQAARGAEFLLLMKQSGRAIARALPAYLNASIRFREGVARSESMQMEMLLLLCGTMNIRKALLECGAKKKDGFLLFATKNELFERFAKSNRVRKIKKVELKLNHKLAGNVAITELLND